jgi:hypothetical protein
MKSALADAITQWAGVEDNMAFLLSAVLDHPLQNYGTLIYFTPIATETRFSIVNAVVEKHLRSDPVHWDVLKLWPKILEKLKKAKVLRNKIAHGAIVRHKRGRTEAIRLSGPTFQMLSPLTQEQMPGMSLHDVRAAFDTFWRAGSAVGHVSLIIEGRRNGFLDTDTLRQKILELEAHLLSKGSAQSPTPPTQGAPTPPSGG